MNVCILSKFPPLEGGIAAKTYWLARAYAAAGLNVHVVSNANSAEEDCRIEGCYPHIQELPGVTLHEVATDFPWHIPEEPHSLAKLVDKALGVIEEHRIDVIDSGYLIPYGIAAFLASRLTGVPYVVRHGGSDLAKFLQAGRLPNLLGRVLEHSAAIITDPDHVASFSGFEAKCVATVPYVPDPAVFVPARREGDRAPRLLYVGKLNWHFERKGLDRIAQCAASVPSSWGIECVAQGKGSERFLSVAACVGATPQLSPFLPPWRMPEVLQQADYVFCLSYDEPIPSFSNLLVEAAWAGARVVVPSEFDLRPYAGVLDGLERRLLKARGAAEDLAAMIVEDWRRSSALGEVKLTGLSGVYDDYINQSLKTLAGASL